ncbi:MAG: helix-hairpin-helix domain-containing protein [Sulfurimonas sp.]|nr:helix-hairpin-helix domain-containing protein [Sulfurimonas sp.]
MKLITALLLFTTLLLATVDINNATADEFTALKGVGVKKAKGIVEYRTTIKCFKTIDELTKVKGIGDSTISKNKEILTLGECKVK